MGWRDFLNPSLVEKVENAEFTTQDSKQITQITQIPPKCDSEITDSLPPNCLTEQGREVFWLYLGEMLCPAHPPQVDLGGGQKPSAGTCFMPPGEFKRWSSRVRAGTHGCFPFLRGHFNTHKGTQILERNRDDYLNRIYKL